MLLARLHPLVVAAPLLGGLLAAVPLAAQQLPIANKCAFYEHSGYAGAMLVLHTGHVVAVDPALAIGAGFAGGVDYQRFDDPRWKGWMTAARVAPGCTAYIGDAGGREVATGSDLAIPPDAANEVVVVGCICD